MTRISVYSKDVDVRGNDKWIGSDAQNQNRTKNFTPDNVATYFNENQVIDLGVELRYFYDTLDPLQERVFGSITFETEIGPQVNFSSISTFILSKYTMGHTDVSQFLDFLVGSNVILSRSNNINMFGYYKIDSIEPYIPDPNFFVVTLTFETGNGYMKEDEDYFISLVQFDQEIPEIPTKTSDLINDGEDGVHPFITAEDAPTPTLQSVTDAGDTTTTTVYLNGGAVVNGFDTTSVVDSSYVVSTNTTTNSSASIDSTGILSLSADGVNFGSIAVNDITSSVQLQFPDKIAGIYTIATTDDFTVPTLQSVTDEGNTVTGTGGYKSTLDGGEFFVDNTSLNTKLRITGDGIVYFTNLAGKTTQLSNYGITGDSVNFIFPNKTSGPVYTLATTADIPVVTGFVPYTGATSNVDLGTHTLSAKDLVINHSSGSGVAASITKGGAGEALTINKTSGSGNAMSVTGGVTQLDELHLTTDLADSYIASAATWNGKQAALVSGTNIKTINGNSVLGSGDLVVGGSSSLAIGTTPITSGTIGRVLFEGTGNVLQQSTNLFWDITNNRLGINNAAPANSLDINGTFRVTSGANALIDVSSTFTTLNRNLGTAQILRGLVVTPTSGTFGFGTGAGNTGTMSVGDGTNFAVLGYNWSPTGEKAVFAGITQGGNQLPIAIYGRKFELYNTSSIAMTMFDTTRNFVIQSGGTHVDAGFKLDVNGTARFQGISRFTVGGNNYININAGANASTPIIDFFYSGVAERRISIGGDTTGLFALNGFLLSSNGTVANAVPLTAGNINSTGGVASLSGLMYVFGTGDNIVQFAQRGLANRGVLGYAVSTNYFQIRTGGATSLSTGTLSTIFDNVGSVGIGGITSVNASAILQTDSTTKGFLPPRMTTTQKNAIATPAAGLMVYDTTLNLISVYNGTIWISL